MLVAAVDLAVGGLWFVNAELPATVILDVVRGAKFGKVGVGLLSPTHGELIRCEPVSILEMRIRCDRGSVAVMLAEMVESLTRSRFDESIEHRLWWSLCRLERTDWLVWPTRNMSSNGGVCVSEGAISLDSF